MKSILQFSPVKNCFFIILLNFSIYLIAEDQKSDQLESFFNNFILKYEISCPLNFEFSIKVNNNEVNRKRYLASLPTGCLNLKNQPQIKKLLSFVPIAKIKNKLRGYMDDGITSAMGYAVESSQDKTRYRAYLAFKRNLSKFSFISYEWFEGEKDYRERTYEWVKDYQNILMDLANEEQLKILDKYKSLLNLDVIHYRTGEDNKQVLYFGLNKNIKHSKIKKFFYEMGKSINKQSNLLTILDDLNVQRFIFISIGIDEVTIYYRTEEWVWPYK